MYKAIFVLIVIFCLALNAEASYKRNGYRLYNNELIIDNELKEGIGIDSVLYRMLYRAQDKEVSINSVYFNTIAMSFEDLNQFFADYYPYLKGIRKIGLGDYAFDSLPPNLMKYQELKTIGISGRLNQDIPVAKLNYFAPELVNLTKLSVIQLRECGVNDAGFQLLLTLLPKDLKRINLHDNNITQITDDICKFRNLRYLNLTNNNIKLVTDCIYDLPLLTINTFSIYNISSRYNPLLENKEYTDEAFTESIRQEFLKRKSVDEKE